MKRYLKLILSLSCAILLIAGVLIAGQFDLDSNMDGTNEFSIDTSGNITSTGALTLTGAATVGGATTMSGTATVTGVTTLNNILAVSSDNTTHAGDITVTGIISVSSDKTDVSLTTGGLSVSMGGGFSTFPTAGYPAGTIIWYNGGSSEDVAGFYGATATVASASSWQKMGNIGK